MEAIILSGGFGTRLRPLTFSCPKPIVPFCNTPITEHQIAALKKADVTKIVLAISENPLWYNQLVEFAHSMEIKYQIEVILSIEKSALGTAGAISLAKKSISAETFFVLNSDIICEYPLREMSLFHRKHKGKGTLFVTKVKDPSKYGVIVSDEQNKILKFVEKPKTFVGECINAGIYCFDKSVFGFLETRNMSIEREVFPFMAQRELLFSFKSPHKDSFWMDIGQPKDYLRGTQLFIDFKKAGNIVGENTKIAESAKVGEHVVLGNNCEVRANSVLENCVLFDESFIGENVQVKDSIVGWRCRLEGNSKVEECCVLEKAVVVKEQVDLKGVKVCSHKCVDSPTVRDSVVL